MKVFETVEQNLKARGYAVRTFATAAEAAAYLDSRIDGKTVGFGGSVTLDAMGLYDLLGRHNTVLWHWKAEDPGAARKAAMNAGAGNRVAATLFGHEKVYFVIGRNKLAPTYEEALWRARNIAAPQNARRLGKKTPCAVKGDRCYDCKSPDRICRALVTLWEPMMGMETEILLVDQDLGM